MTFDSAFADGFVRLAEAVEAGRIPGGVLGLVDTSGARKVAAVGKAQNTPVVREMTIDTWFDLASLTKVLFTTPRILELAAAGTIDLDAPLTTILPDFAQYNPDNWQRKITFRQCLGHQTPLPGVFPLYTYGTDANLLRHFVLQHAWPAGPAVYSDLNFILLGIVLERLAGKRLRDIEPGFGFGWSGDPAQSAATEYCLWRGRVLVGEVHDENCAALAGSGHAGLFGPADAVLDFAAGILNSDTPAVALMRTPLAPRRTHGWERPYEGWSGGELCSSDTIGHTGFTGTGLWIDFARGRAWTLLTNRVHPSRHFDSGIFALRRAVGDAINRE
jgi:CubicO group peptidase (beta-lactamase class C family)